MMKVLEDAGLSKDARKKNIKIIANNEMWKTQIMEYEKGIKKEN